MYSKDAGARKLVTVFETCGIHVVHSAEIHQVPALLKRDRPDALLCYRVLPTDIRLVRELLKPIGLTTPLFAVYSRASAVDRINTLRLGAKRVYIEPFPVSRLVQDVGLLSYEIPEVESIRIGHFSLDVAAVSAMYKDSPLSLTKKQFRALTLFLERANTVVTKVQLWERVWGLEEYPKSNCVEALVSRLRASLPKEVIIEQVYGVGYRMRVTTTVQLSAQRAVQPLAKSVSFASA